ncbi:hypothetical protein Tco_1573757 [Tanacetum coccineum]
MGLGCVSSVRGLRSALQANDLCPSSQPPHHPILLSPLFECHVLAANDMLWDCQRGLTSQESCVPCVVF